MTLAKRLNSMEQRIKALEDRLAAMDDAFVALADDLAQYEFLAPQDDQQETQTTTLDGERIESRERDQNESLG